MRAMDIAKEIKKVLAYESTYEKDHGLEFVNEILEYGHGYDLKAEDIAEGVKLLLVAVLQEEEPMMKRRLLRTLFQAVVSHQGMYLRKMTSEWDVLAAALPSFDKWQFQYALNTLGLTGQTKYVPILEGYIQHADPDIRKRALRAINNINILVAYDAAAQKEGKGQEDFNGQEQIFVNERGVMDIAEEIKKILAYESTYEKEHGLEFVNEILEYGYGYELKAEGIAEGVKLLLAAALQEEEPLMKRVFLRTLFQAVVFHQGIHLRKMTSEWDMLAAALSSFDKWQFQYALDILGLTGQTKYVPTLEGYTQHVDPDIRKWALKAIDNIKVLEAHDTDSQNG